MLKIEQAGSDVSIPVPEPLTAGSSHHAFGSGPMKGRWGLLGWWGLFRDGRDPRLVAFGRSQAKGFSVIRDWVDAANTPAAERSKHAEL